MPEQSGPKAMTTTSFPCPTKNYKAIKNDEPFRAVKVVTPLLVLTAGTGGLVTAQGTEVLHRWAHTPQIHIERSSRKNIDTRSPAEHVVNIRQVLGLSMSDLAALLGVTRPTAYAWLKGEEPKPDAVNRIQHLSQIADGISQANIPGMDKLVHRPVLDGRSLFSTLKTNEDASEIIALLKGIAAKESQNRLESKGFGKNLRSIEEVVDEVSIPIYYERS
jgi:transcriptional regulator with XRE-family HTH domain